MLTVHEEIVKKSYKRMENMIMDMIKIEIPDIEEKLQKAYDIANENKKLSVKLLEKENEIKKKENIIKELEEYRNAVDNLLNKLEEDKVIEKYDDWDHDPETGAWYHVGWYIYKKLQYEIIQESW